MGPEERSFLRPLKSCKQLRRLSKPCMRCIHANVLGQGGLLKVTTSEVPGREDLACDGPAFLIAMLCYCSSRTALREDGRRGEIGTTRWRKDDKCVWLNLVNQKTDNRDSMPNEEGNSSV